MPAPNRSPTTFMPSISGPSMTSIGRPPRSAIVWRSSSVSASTCASMPFTSACVIRSPTGSERHSSAAASTTSPALLCCLGDLEQPLGGVGTAVEDDVLDPLAQLRLDLGRTTTSAPALTMPMSRPASIAWYRKTAWIASRTGLLPRKREAHVGDAAGDLGARQVLLDPAGGLDEVQAVRRVLLDARRDREDVGVEDDVLGREARPRRPGSGRPARRSPCGARGCRPGRPRRRPSRPRRRRTCGTGGPARGTCPRPPSWRSS